MRQLQQAKEVGAMQLASAAEEAGELRRAKEAAVVEKEQAAVRAERRSQQQQVRKHACVCA